MRLIPLSLLLFLGACSDTAAVDDELAEIQAQLAALQATNSMLEAQVAAL